MGYTSTVGHGPERDGQQITSQPARDTTARLCAAVCENAVAPLPPRVRRAAERSLLNVLGTAIGASRESAVETVLAKAAAHSGRPVAPVPGRPERVDLTHAALVTGIAAHLDDFDDTHLATVIHPGAATLGASLGLAHQRHASGRELLTAFALGCEVQLRVGVAMSPSHYDAGWHITGTCGVVVLQ
jgi:2-methylcitrate dehydratase PrpD